MPNSFDTAQQTILAIEDEGDVLTCLASILAGAGYRCHCSSNAAAARELACQVHPDLIIADINLGGTSGLALCDEIKLLPGLAAKAQHLAAPSPL